MPAGLRFGWMGACGGALAVLLAATLPVMGADATDSLAAARTTLQSAHATLLAKIDTAKRNSDDAYDIVTRIEGELADLNAPQTGSERESVADITLHATLDASWVTAVTSGTCPAPAPSGASETCYRATSDGTLQPLAVYVPPSVSLGAGAPLVVALRGREETESDLLSRSELRMLADHSKAILVAPYGRGRAIYDAPATQDVLDALATAETFAGPAPHRVYLAGFSMGGMAAFHVAAAAPKRFAAILCIAGALDARDRDAARAFGKPVYVVSAERDTLMPAELGRDAVRFLSDHGVPARYYEQPGGEHRLHSVLPAMTLAWNDMFSGVSRGQPPPGAGSMPEPRPTAGASKPM